MINNYPTLVFSMCCAAIATFGTSCARRETLPRGFQGVVEYEERVMAFEVAGRIAKVNVHRGDVVRDGETLAELNPTLQKLLCDVRASDVAAATADLALLEAGARSEDVASAAAELRSATATEGLARKSLERASALHRTGSVAQAELDRTQSEFDRASAIRSSAEQRLSALRHGARPQEVARAKARLASVNAAAKLEDERLERYTLRAHGPGTVVDVHVKQGELAGVGTQVASVADLTHPYADVFVPQGDLNGLKIGAKAIVHVDAAGAELPATVEHIASRTEFTPRFLFSEQERPSLVVRVRVRIDDPGQRLHAGVPAFARIVR